MEEPYRGGSLLVRRRHAGAAVGTARGAQPMVPRGGRSSQGSFSVASKPIKSGKLLENWNFETDIENIILAQGPESRIK